MFVGALGSLGEKRLVTSSIPSVVELLPSMALKDKLVCLRGVAEPGLADEYFVTHMWKHIMRSEEPWTVHDILEATLALVHAHTDPVLQLRDLASHIVSSSFKFSVPEGDQIASMEAAVLLRVYASRGLLTDRLALMLLPALRTATFQCIQRILRTVNGMDGDVRTEYVSFLHWFVTMVPPEPAFIISHYFTTRVFCLLCESGLEIPDKGPLSIREMRWRTQYQYVDHCVLLLRAIASAVPCVREQCDQLARDLVRRIVLLLPRAPPPNAVSALAVLATMLDATHAPVWEACRRVFQVIGFLAPGDFIVALESLLKLKFVLKTPHIVTRVRSHLARLAENFERDDVVRVFILCIKLGITGESLWTLAPHIAKDCALLQRDPKVLVSFVRCCAGLAPTDFADVHMCAMLDEVLLLIPAACASLTPAELAQLVFSLFALRNSARCTWAENCLADALHERVHLLSPEKCVATFLALAELELHDISVGVAAAEALTASHELPLQVVVSVLSHLIAMKKKSDSAAEGSQWYESVASSQLDSKLAHYIEKVVPSTAFIPVALPMLLDVLLSLELSGAFAAATQQCEIAIAAYDVENLLQLLQAMCDYQGSKRGSQELLEFASRQFECMKKTLAHQQLAYYAEVLRGLNLVGYQCPQLLGSVIQLCLENDPKLLHGLMVPPPSSNGQGSGGGSLDGNHVPIPLQVTTAKIDLLSAQQ